MAEGAGAMRRHRVDGDEKVGGRHGGGELVEGDLGAERLDDARVLPGQGAARLTALQIDPIDLGYSQEPRDIGRLQGTVGGRSALRVCPKHQAELGHFFSVRPVVALAPDGCPARIDREIGTSAGTVANSVLRWNGRLNSGTQASNLVCDGLIFASGWSGGGASSASIVCLTRQPHANPG